MNTRSTILGVSLVLALAYIIFLQGCNKHKCADPEIVEIIKRDSTTHVDTLYYDSTRYKYITVNVPTPYYDTIPVPMPVNFNDISETNFDYLMKFPAIYEDTISNDTISIFYRAKVRGYLDNLTLGYKVFTPYVIKETTTIQTEVTKKKAFNGFYVGMDVGFIKDSLSHVAPTVEASFNRFNISVGYDLMDKDIVAGVKVKLGK